MLGQMTVLDTVEIFMKIGIIFSADFSLCNVILIIYVL